MALALFLCAGFDGFPADLFPEDLFYTKGKFVREFFAVTPNRDLVMARTGGRTSKFREDS